MEAGKGVDIKSPTECFPDIFKVNRRDQCNFGAGCIKLN